MGSVATFDIDFVDGESDVSPGHALGVIVLGGFRERFEAALEVWDRADYRRQWHEALTRVVDGASESALVTSMYDPASANYIRWWPMYCFGSTVRFQEHLLFLEQLSERPALDDLFRAVPPYVAASDDGAISEWQLPLDALKAKLDGTRA